MRGFAAAISPREAPSAAAQERGKGEAKYLTQFADVDSVSERA